MQVLIYIFSIWSNTTKLNGKIICMYNMRHCEIDTYKRSLLTFRGPCIVMYEYSYNESQEMHYFSNLFDTVR